MTIEGRRKQVLKGIVDHYIKSKEPVSSQMIIDKYNLSVSSATIRNDMHYLEKEGYIRKPHISAGRVPTQKGYRLFVDWLVELSKLTERRSFFLMERFTYQKREISQLLHYTTFLLAQISNYVGFILSPRLEEMRLEHITLVRPAGKETLLIIGSELGIMETLAIRSSLEEVEIEKANKILNERLRGMKFQEIRKMASLEDENGMWHDHATRKSFYLLQKLIDEKVKQKLYVEGILNLLRLMDGPKRKFEDLIALMKLLEDKKKFTKVLLKQREDGKEGTVVSIGDENPLPGLNDYSMMTLDFLQSGILGVLGPLGMDYSKAFSTTKYIGNRLKAILSMSC